jgi:type II secretory pathway pseudopilin PulG
MVALAVLSILIYMAFASFSIASAVSTSNQNREAVLEDMSTVLDQLTKELRQTVTVNDGTGKYGVLYPAGGSTDFKRDITTIAAPTTPLAPNLYYTFGANSPDGMTSGDRPILTFYTVDVNGAKHRISYSLGVPSIGGIARQYWASQSYEPCQIIYSNETYSSITSTWTGVTRQPVTGQVITNFTVIRPSWSNKVIQIVLQAMVRNGSGGGSTTITRIAQISLRQ